MCLPATVCYLHAYKAVSVPEYEATRRKAAFGKTILCPEVPVQGMQVNLRNTERFEDMIQQSIDSLNTVALVPVTSVPNHNAYFHLAHVLVKVKIHTVADLFAFVRFNSKTTTVGRRIQLLDVACQEVGEGCSQRESGIKEGQSRITSPCIVIDQVAYPLRAQSYPLSLDHDYTPQNRATARRTISISFL